ncbi:MAG: AbrB/MazE/SpoVT family DNA-binding domain-containing protein [Candidatus Njordarchaeia archaeon]
MSVIKLKVGPRGEIYTTKEIRRFLNIEGSSEVVAILTKDGLIIKPIKPLKEILKKRKTKLTITVEDFEKASLQVQEEIMSAD